MPRAPYCCGERAAVGEALQSALEATPQALAASRCGASSALQLAWQPQHVLLPAYFGELFFKASWGDHNPLFSACSATFLDSSFTVLARHAEGTDLTWRSLYACDNGWYELQPGCFEVLDLPSVNCLEDFNYCHPTHCILDGRDLGWTAAPSELLVVDAKEVV